MKFNTAGSKQLKGSPLTKDKTLAPKKHTFFLKATMLLIMIALGVVFLELQALVAKQSFQRELSVNLQLTLSEVKALVNNAFRTSKVHSAGGEEKLQGFAEDFTQLKNRYLALLKQLDSSYDLSQENDDLRELSELSDYLVKSSELVFKLRLNALENRSMAYKEANNLAGLIDFLGSAVDEINKLISPRDADKMQLVNGISKHVINFVNDSNKALNKYKLADDRGDSSDALNNLILIRKNFYARFKEVSVLLDTKDKHLIAIAEQAFFKIGKTLSMLNDVSDYKYSELYLEEKAQEVFLRFLGFIQDTDNLIVDYQKELNLKTWVFNKLSFMKTFVSYRLWTV